VELFERRADRHVSGQILPDGRFFATADQHGDVVIRDVAASFQATDIANTTSQQSHIRRDK
jgi:hypothetical protein